MGVSVKSGIKAFSLITEAIVIYTRAMMCEVGEQFEQ